MPGPSGDIPASTIHLLLNLKQLLARPPGLPTPPPGYQGGPAMQQFLGYQPMQLAPGVRTLVSGALPPVPQVPGMTPDEILNQQKYRTNQGDWRSVLGEEQRNDLFERGANRPGIIPQPGDISAGGPLSPQLIALLQSLRAYYGGAR